MYVAHSRKKLMPCWIYLTRRRVMGYRSDVAYAIRFKTKEHRIRFMAAQALDPEIDLKDFNLIDDKTILLSYDEVKWYDEDDWVKAHRRLLEDAKEQGCAWTFCRVGEEIGDIDQYGDDGKDDEGNDMDAPDIISPSQSLYIETEGELYPIGEQL